MPLGSQTKLSHEGVLVKLPEHLGEYMVYPMIRLNNNPQFIGVGAVYPSFKDLDGVSVWFGLKPHAHERVVWIFAIKVTVWFHCVELGNSIKPTDTGVDEC